MWLIVGLLISNFKICGGQNADFSFKKCKTKTQNIQLYIPEKRCPDPLYPAEEISLHKWVTISGWKN